MHKTQCETEPYMAQHLRLIYGEAWKEEVTLHCFHLCYYLFRGMRYTLEEGADMIPEEVLQATDLLYNLVWICEQPPVSPVGPEEKAA